jgi:hypothetical protein
MQARRWDSFFVFLCAFWLYLVALSLKKDRYEPTRCPTYPQAKKAEARFPSRGTCSLPCSILSRFYVKGDP